jgi:hypothetical protein
MRILKFAAAIAAGVVALGVAAYAYFIHSPDPCVYRKPKPAHNGDEVRQGSRVN